MATGWKRVAERLLVGAGAQRWGLARVSPSAVVLAYHNVVPRGGSVAGEASLHVDQADFGVQLDLLLETHEVVPLDQVLDASQRPRAAITFDDAYRGALTAGAEELERRGLPYTVFVAPGILGRACWWDLLAHETGEMPAELRDEALVRRRGEQGSILAWAGESGWALPDSLPDHAVPATAEELRSWARRPGVAVGGHSWDHPNLAVLEVEEVREQGRRCRRWLEAELGVSPRWFAYPYGLQSPETRNVIGEVFPEGAVLIEGGLAVRGGSTPADRTAVPRVNVPRSLTPEGLRLRLAGLLG